MEVRENETHEQARERLDSQLGVYAWQIQPSSAPPRRTDPDAPAWWHGDEEASQQFLRSMGVRLD